VTCHLLVTPENGEVFITICGQEFFSLADFSLSGENEERAPPYITCLGICVDSSFYSCPNRGRYGARKIPIGAHFCVSQGQA
jgi:hypothetical protein